MPKTISAVDPDWYHLRKIEHGNAYLRIRANVMQKTVDTNGDSHTEYEYDEQEIAVSIPDELITTEQLFAFIDSKKTELLANVSPSFPASEPEEEKDIRKKDINIVRKELKELRVD